MVRTKNLYSKRGRPPKNKFLLNNNLQLKKINIRDGATLNVYLRHGKFTSCDITLQETSVNNNILRVPLERYDFTVLRNISCDLNISTLGRSIKRKRNSAFLSKDVQRSHKKMRINGSSLNESRQNSPNPLADNTLLSKKLEKLKEKVDKDIHLRKSVKLLNEEQKQIEINLRESKTFDKSKLKIRLGPKSGIKRKEKKAPRNSSITDKEHTVKKSELDTLKLSNMLTAEATAGETFYLKFKRDKPITEGRFNYKFQKLITDVKNMALPTATWKIKVIIRQNKISAITFTNKQELERSVTFSSESERYKVVIENKLAHLLGSPETIDSPEDIEILLDVLECLDSASPIIYYR